MTPSTAKLFGQATTLSPERLVVLRQAQYRQACLNEGWFHGSVKADEPATVKAARFALYEASAAFKKTLQK